MNRGERNTIFMASGVFNILIIAIYIATNWKCATMATEAVWMKWQKIVRR